MLSYMEEKELLKVLKENINITDLHFVTSLAVSKEKNIGLTIPAVKKIAKDLREENLLNISMGKYIEVDQLLGYWNFLRKVNDNEKMDFLVKLFKKTDTWMVVDTVVMASKFKDKKIIKEFIFNNQFSEYTFLCRASYMFGICNFCNDLEMAEYFLSSIKETDEYYINMAIAWLIQSIALYYEEKAYLFLSGLDNKSFIKRKAISKISDSFRFSKETKLKFKKLLH